MENADNALFLKACRQEKTQRTPVWLMRQAGRYQASYREIRSRVPMLELCKNPDLAAQVTVNAVNELGVDAAIIFSDLLLILEPMGFHLAYTAGEGPVITPSVKSPADVDRMQDPVVDESMSFVSKAIRQTRAALPAHIPLIGFVGAPFTLAYYLIEGKKSRDLAATKSFMKNNPKAWDKLLARLTGALASLAHLQKKAGAQAIQVFDSWVGALTPAEYEQYVMPHTQKLFQDIEGECPLIHFGTKTTPLLELMKQAGGHVIGLDSQVLLNEAWTRLGDTAVMGNLNPDILLQSKQVIHAEVQKILHQANGRPGHIFNLGHGVLPQTPVDNVKYLVQVVKELSER